MGSWLDQNCTCTTRPWGQQHETINGSLRYLITEEIEEQHIVYGQTAGWLDDGQRVLHKLDWSLTSRANNRWEDGSLLTTILTWIWQAFINIDFTQLSLEPRQTVTFSWVIWLTGNTHTMVLTRVTCRYRMYHNHSYLHYTHLTFTIFQNYQLTVHQWWLLQFLRHIEEMKQTHAVIEIPEADTKFQTCPPCTPCKHTLFKSF